MNMQVTKPGLQSLIVDLGRDGFASVGVPPSGAMDSLSARVANQLVGNQPSAAVLEMTLVGPVLTFTRETLVAASGARFLATLDGKPFPWNESVLVRDGSVLDFGPCRSGARAVLAIAGGGFDVPEILGSRSCYLPGGFGGFQGRPLRAGDALGAVAPESARGTPRLVRRRFVGELLTFPTSLSESGRSSPQVLRVVPGPQDAAFSATAKGLFHSKPFRVSSQSDRMGIRLEGPALVGPGQTTDVSAEPNVHGAIQVTSAGQPIILCADRPTTGGYAKIATVIEADFPTLANLRAGDDVFFARCSVDDARLLRQLAESKLARGFEDLPVAEGADNASTDP